MMEEALRLLLGFAIAYWLPGRLALACLAPALRPEGRVPVAIALGIVLVSVPAVLVTGLAGLGHAAYLGAPLVFGTALAEALVLGAILWRQGRLRDLVPRRPSRTSLGLLVLTVAATGYFLAVFDADMFFEDSCVVRASLAIGENYLRPEILSVEAGGPEAASPYLTDPMHAQADGRNTFLMHNQGQRLGPGIIAAPMYAMFGVFGFRVLYALQGLLLPGLGFLLGMRILGRRPAAWLVAVLLTFSPYAIETRMFDENFLASIFGTLTLLLLLLQTAAPLAAGVSLALFLSLRHVGALLVPVLLWYAWRHVPAPRHAAWRLLAGTLVFLLPEILLHAFLLAGPGQWFEGAMGRAPAPHDLFGWKFDLDVLLNFPFVPQPLRSPYTPFPTLALFPLDVVRRFGVLLVVLVPAGVARLFRTGRPRAWLLAGWFVPLFALLLGMSNWTEPNKMGVPATVLAPLVLAIVAGGLELLDSGRPWTGRLAWLAGGLAVPLAVVPLLARWEAPADPRVFAKAPTYHKVIHTPGTVLHTPESPPYVEWESARYGLQWLPALRPHGCHPAVWGRRLQRLAADLRAPGLADFRLSLGSLSQRTLMGHRFYLGPLSLLRAAEVRGRDAPPDAPVPFEGEARRVTLDLSLPPVFATRPFEARAAEMMPVELDLTGDAIWRVGGLRLPGVDGPRTLIAGRGTQGDVVIALMPPGVPDEDRGADDPRVRRVDPAAFPDVRVPLVLPDGLPVRLFDVPSAVPARFYSRYAVPGQDGTWLSDTTPFSP